MTQFNVTAHAVEESPIVPGRKSVTSYTLPTGASGLSEDYKLRKELGLPCTMIQQLSRELCVATSLPDNALMVVENPMSSSQVTPGHLIAMWSWVL